MTTRVVTDEQLATYTRREHELYQRFFKGTVPPDYVLRTLQDMLEGKFSAITACPSRLIDLDEDPFGLSDELFFNPRNQLRGAIRGILRFNPAKIVLHLDDSQRGEKSIEGTELAQILSDKRLLNANVLDHLLTNPRLIPEEWKGDGETGKLRIFFWGTIYHEFHGHKSVRYMYWNHVGREWRWGRDSIYCNGFCQNMPAAILID